jgi:hypothetical protein
MSGFSADWLGLREPYDAAARDSSLVAHLARTAGAAGAIEVVDLGAGTGANFRYLAPRLGATQHWLLVDDDVALLEGFERATDEWATSSGVEVTAHGNEIGVRGLGLDCRVRRRRLDLARELDALELPPGALVSSSALLDLVSAEWLVALAARCRAARAPLCFALTYDGRTSCTPSEPEDREVLELFNRHQRTDKGFGPALGPTAAQAAERAFAAVGYRIAARRSDWRLGPSAGAMQAALLDGWLAAAIEIAPERRAALTAWHRRRRAHVEHGRSEIVVGHVDLAGWPAG